MVVKHPEIWGRWTHFGLVHIFQMGGEKTTNQLFSSKGFFCCRNPAGFFGEMFLYGNSLRASHDLLTYDGGSNVSHQSGEKWGNNRRWSAGEKCRVFPCRQWCFIGTCSSGNPKFNIMIVYFPYYILHVPCWQQNVLRIYTTPKESYIIIS